MEASGQRSKRLRSAILRFYGFQFFFGLLLWVPVFYEYQKRIGLSDGEIFRIQSIYYLAFCLLEIPTGVAADLWGRRLCMGLGAAVVTVSNLLPIFAPSYAGFVAHFLMVALARSLISGASSAYIYDLMKQEGAAEAYRLVEGKARAYGLVGKMVCWAAVGALMEWRLSSPYWLTLAANAVALGFMVGLPPLPAQTVPSRWEPQQVAVAFARSPVLALVMGQGIAVFVLERLCQVNLFKPILGAHGFSVASYGWVMALMAAFEATGALGLRKLGKSLGSGSILWLAGGMAFSLYMVPSMGRSGVLAALCVFSLGSGLAFPVQRQAMNDAIPDSRFRATLLSLESIVDRAACAWAAFVLGDYLSRGQMNEFIWLASGATLAAVGCVQIALLWPRVRTVLGRG